MATASAERVILGYSNSFLAIRRRLRTYTAAQWAALEDYRDRDIDRFARAMAPAVTGSQLQVARLTDNYLASIASLIIGAKVLPVGISPTLVNDAAMRGVPAVEVYARAGPEVWTALSNGATPDAAFSQGLDRAQSQASTDLQLAKTHTAREVVSNDERIAGFRRVPEGGNPCELCLIAAEPLYEVADLMPIHDNCSCDVVPVYESGNNVDTSTLRDTGELDQGQERGQPEVREHGELGPVLTVGGNDFFVPASACGIRSAEGEF